MNKMFVHYSKTKAEFISAGLPSTYNNHIVFIKGDANNNGSCIYTHGVYFANIAELINALNFVKGISVGGQNYNAAAGGGYVAFGAKDPTTVSVNVGSNGIEIGLTEAFVKRVSDLETALKGVTDDYLTSTDDEALREYADQAEADALKAAKEYTDAEIQKLDSATLAQQVEANKQAIETLNGEDTGKSAREIVQDEVAKQLESENISDSFDTLKEMAEYLSSHPQDVTDMNAAIQQAQTDATNAGTAAQNAQNTADANKTAIEAMDLEEKSGFVTKISQTDGKVAVEVVESIEASKVSVADTANKLEASNVEDALAELASFWEWEEL